MLGTTSLGVAVAAGLPDGAGRTADETFALAQRLTTASIAVTVDIEAGFSDDPGAVARYVSRLADLGVLGVNLEDSDADGRLVDPALAAAKIAAIAAAAPAIFINARTDPFWIGGDDDPEARHDEAVRRARRYLAAGATGVFVPGTLTIERVAALADEIPAPLNVLVQPGVPLAALASAGVGTGEHRIAALPRSRSAPSRRPPVRCATGRSRRRRARRRTTRSPRCREGRAVSLGVARPAGLHPHGLPRHLGEVGRERQLAEPVVEVALPPLQQRGRGVRGWTAWPPMGRRPRAAGRAWCGS